MANSGPKYQVIGKVFHDQYGTLTEIRLLRDVSGYRKNYRLMINNTKSLSQIGDAVDFSLIIGRAKVTGSGKYKFGNTVYPGGMMSTGRFPIIKCGMHRYFRS